MRTEPALTFLGRLLDKIRPSDLLHSENRVALRLRIESLGIDRLQIRYYICKEIQELRTWLSEARELSTEALAEICGILYISMGDLVTE